jgi:chemotaxis protein MotB
MTPVSLVDRPTLSNPSGQKRRSDARWLITFADLAAVMVAFFVLLFSMAEVDSDKWEGATTAFDRQFRISESTVTPRPVETTNITQRVEASALDLRYLERLIGEQIDSQDALKEARIEVSPDRIAVDFPGEMIFANGRVGVSAGGRESLFILGGLFAGIENQIAVVGHAVTEQADDGQAATDWEFSLIRAARIARALAASGYDRAIEVQGRSGSYFGGPAPADTTEGPRAIPVRRIEIIVQAETGDGR